MRGNKRQARALGLVALLLTIDAGCRREPPPPAPAQQPAAAGPKEFVHPFIPSPQVVKPAVAPCRARDLHDLVGAVRQFEKKTLPAVKKAKTDGAPSACHAEAENRRWSSMVDVFARDASGCVAKDSELDSQWNQLQSAVVALDGCVDCTRPAAARVTSCQRAGELLTAAEKATP
jgi:hypothetical protein